MVHDSHRKTFSLISSVSSKPPILSRKLTSKRGRVSREHEAVVNVPRSPTPLRNPAASATSFSSLVQSDPSLLPSPTHSDYSDRGTSPTPRHHARVKMSIMRKVRKFSRILSEVPDSVDESASERRLGDMLEDPLATMSPVLLSPSPSETSFPDTSNSGILKRSATVGFSAGQALQNTSVHRARSIASLQPALAIPPPASMPRSSPISPILFAWPEGVSSESSSVLYSDSLVPSKAPSIIYSEPVLDDSPLSDAPTHNPIGDNRAVSPESKPISRDRCDSSGSSPRKPQQSPRPIKPPPRAHLMRKHSDAALPEALLRAAPPASRPSSRGSRAASTAPPPSPRLLPPPSPEPRRRIPSPVPGHLIDSVALPRRTSSLRRIKGTRPPAKRRLSLDLRAFAAEPTKGATLRKSRSLWMAKRAPEERVLEETAEAWVDGETARLGEPMSEKQRALNVRRAKKMMQVFGDKPPPALFQITNIRTDHTDNSPEDDAISILTTVSENRRDSRATYTSIASTLSASHRSARDSFQSHKSHKSEPSSPLVFTEAEGEGDRTFSRVLSEATSQPEQQPQPQAQSDPELQPHSEAVQYSDLTLYPPPSPVPHLKPSIQSLSVASTISHTRSHSASSSAPLTAHLQHEQRTLHTPPPFAPTFPFAPQTRGRLATPAHLHAHPQDHDDPEGDRARVQSPSPRPGAPEFRARRLRAAKLSRFFGVALNDLAEVLSAPPSPVAWGAAPPQSGWPQSEAADSVVSLQRAPTPLRAMSPTPVRPTSPAPAAGEAPVQDQAQAQTMAQAQVRGYAPEQGHSRGQSTTVEMAAEMKSPFRVRRLEKNVVKEMDMREVIEQLRRMR
ncbi:hypothetical protein AcV5_004421 [Taiwanofungus camphoratus]|nr:hypothetical protein AcV5_004421 [Antrodia cinnamomea]KAI0961443.1 hypothetical protein AcV7_000542 [Antrodia cinnamomea]